MQRIQLCKTSIPVANSPIFSPPHERGLSTETPIGLAANQSFRDSYHIQNTRPYPDVSETFYTGSLVCGHSADALKNEKVDCCMRSSTPREEPEHVTNLRKEAYENCLNAGSFLFLTPAVSQTVACDGMRKTTTADGQEIAPGTLPIY